MAPTTATEKAAATRGVPATPSLGRPLKPLDERRFRLVVGACTAAVGAFLALRLTAWPPHEDETLALYVGNRSLSGVLDTVLSDRGGAPLHFVFAWAVAHLGGGLPALRLVSAVFAVASIPLIAALAARLADRTIAALATALAATSWVLLFHGIYARMYSLFLFAGALSYLALLAALRRPGRRMWAAWVGSVLLAVAIHPYGALVLASQVAFVALVRERLREAAVAVGAVALLGIPFWITDLVLAGRFDVGVGVGGGEKLGGPIPVARYLGEVASDFSAGPVLLPAVLALAAFGARALARTERRSALLVAASFGTPTLAFVVARLGGSAAPETRHLIFTLPFFATLVATALVAIARTRRPGATAAAALCSALLIGGGVGWAWQKTPALFLGEPAAHSEARRGAAEWLVATSRPGDVLLGYEPVFLEAWERATHFSRLVLPRADAKLAAAVLRDAERPLGRGVWILNAADTTDLVDEISVARQLPRPAPAFEARAFGPFLVVRTRDAVRTPRAYLRSAAAVMVLGKTLEIGDADVNFETVARAAERLGYEPWPSSLSASASSR